ncbi:MAG: hypothetical protein JWM76_1115 [Pseudonocardiales bacterium]|nr:hypothetical protein [Pseudonocardiales bacterium]
MSTKLIDMIEAMCGRSTTLLSMRAVLTIPTEVSERRLTQRRVIDLKRHAAALCCR